MGLRGKVSRTTLADANERHDWRIFADFAQVLIGVHDHRMLVIHSGSIWIKACMLWTRPPSTYVSRCAHVARPAWQHPHTY
jgi:hypothetical protein